MINHTLFYNNARKIVIYFYPNRKRIADMLNYIEWTSDFPAVIHFNNFLL